MKRRPPSRAEAGAEHHRLGRAGEQAAAAFLRRAGYRIEARNLRTIHGEIDLLIRRRRTWIAVEVKTRRRHPAPEGCVGPRQTARLWRALRALAPQLRPRPQALRLDVVAIRLEPPELRHFPGQVEPL